jgi:hypothetical protein
VGVFTPSVCTVILSTGVPEHIHVLHCFAGCQIKSKLPVCIKRRQSQFLGHVMRRSGLENFMTAGNIEGKIFSERQCEKMLY